MAVPSVRTVRATVETDTTAQVNRLEWPIKENGTGSVEGSPSAHGQRGRSCAEFAVGSRQRLVWWCACRRTAQTPVGKPLAMSQSAPVADAGLPGGHVVGATKASIGKTSPAIQSSPIADLPGGHAVGGSKAPVAGVTILETAADPPVPMPPIEKAPEPRTTEPKPVTSVIADAKAPCSGWNADGGSEQLHRRLLRSDWRAWADRPRSVHAFRQELSAG